MTMPGKEKSTAPIDADVGDEVDVEETGQTISSREIEAVVLSTEPVEERAAQLRRMRAELQARFTTGRGRDLSPLVTEIDNALARLSGSDTAEGSGRV